MTENFDRNTWNWEVARYLVGRKVMIAIMYERAGEVVRREHMHGVVEQATPTAGIAVALEGKRAGETFWLPPELRAFTACEPEIEWNLDTGETITGAEFTSTWTFAEK